MLSTLHRRRSPTFRLTVAGAAALASFALFNVACPDASQATVALPTPAHGPFATDTDTDTEQAQLQQMLQAQQQAELQNEQAEQQFEQGMQQAQLDEQQANDP